MKLTLALCFCLYSTVYAVGQKYMAVRSEISFFSAALIEDITARNTSLKSAFDLNTNQIVFSVPINKFEFAKALMKEHFNEKYMESDKYPKATFNGKFSKSETDNEVTWAEGILEIHGIKQRIKVPGKLVLIGGEASLICNFTVQLADYQIKIPQLLFQNIAEEIEISINIYYEIFEN